MTTTQTTPLPWTVDDLGAEHFCETNHRWGIGAAASPVYRVAKVEGHGGESEANARLICRAVNAHAALVAACREAVKECKGHTLMQLRAALALAEPT